MNHIRTLVVLALSILSILLIGCGVNHQVYRYKGSEMLNKDGVYYWLPETILLADIRVVTTKRTVPKLASETDYDNAVMEIYGLLPADLPAIKAGVSKTSIKDAAIRTQARPDRSQTFFVDVRGSGMEKRDLEITLAQEGFITDGTSKVEDRTLETVVAVVKTSAEIAGKVIGVGSTIAPANTGTTPVEKAKARLLDLIDRRIKLICFEGVNGAISKDTYERALVALETDISKAEVPFLGELESKEVVHTFRILPKPAHTGPQVFRLATYNPLLAGSFARISPIESILAVPTPGVFVPGNEVWLALEAENSSPPSTLGSPTSESSGFYYRIPSQIYVNVFDGTRLVKNDHAAIAQLGSLVRLPGHVNGRLASYKIEYFSETGSLKKLAAGSEPVDMSKTAGLSDATGAITKGMFDRSNSELLSAKSENDLLKMRIENIELKKKLAELESATIP